MLSIGIHAALFVIAFAGGSLVEYGLHRLMHARWMRWSPLARVHARHHAQKTAQSWWKESLDYLALASPYGLAGLLTLTTEGVAWFLGATAYAFAAGTVHAFSHDLTWLGTEISHHSRHHLFPRKNFGIVTSAWDRVFRTHHEENR